MRESGILTIGPAHLSFFVCPDCSNGGQIDLLEDSEVSAFILPNDVQDFPDAPLWCASSAFRCLLYVVQVSETYSSVGSTTASEHQHTHSGLKVVIFKDSFP